MATDRPSYVNATDVVGPEFGQTFVDLFEGGPPGSVVAWETERFTDHNPCTDKDVSGGKLDLKVTAYRLVPQG